MARQPIQSDPIAAAAASQLTVREAVFRLLRARPDHHLRQSRIDRVADVPRFSRRLPLRARAAGIGRARHGRRLRPGDAQRRRWSTSIRRSASATRSATCSPPSATARRSSSSPASRRARSCRSSVPVRRAGRPNFPSPMSNGAASRRGPRTCRRRSRALTISPCSRRAGRLRLGAGRRLGSAVRAGRCRAGSAARARRQAACCTSSPMRSTAPSGRSWSSAPRRRATAHGTRTIALAERHQAPVWVSPLSAATAFPRTIRCSPASSPPIASGSSHTCRARPHPRRRRAGLHLSCRGHSGRTSRRRRAVPADRRSGHGRRSPVGTAIVCSVRLGLAICSRCSSTDEAAAARPAGRAAPARVGRRTRLTDA